MNKIIMICILKLLISTENKQNKHVIKNLNDNIKDNIETLVLFYNKKSENLKLATLVFQNLINFIKESNELKNLKILLLDCEDKENKNSCQNYQIGSNVEVKFFYNEEIENLDFDLEEYSVIKFLMKKLKIYYLKLDDLVLLEEIKKHFFHLLIFKGDSDSYKNEINRVFNDIDIYKMNLLNVILDEKLEKKLNITEEGVYFNSLLSNETIKYIDDSNTNIIKFIFEKIRDYIDILNTNNLREIILKKLPVLVYFYDKKPIHEVEFKKIKENKIRIVKSNNENIYGKDLKKYIGFNKKIGLVIIKPVKNIMEKYIYNKDEITTDLIDQFIENFYNNKLERYYKSEDVIESNENPKEIYGLNYRKEVLDNDKHVVVLVYAHYCKVSKLALDFYSDFAKRYNNIKFVKFNGSKNETEYLGFSGFPKIFLYKYKDNSKTRIDLKENVFKEKLAKFLENNIEDLVLSEEL